VRVRWRHRVRRMPGTTLRTAMSQSEIVSTPHGFMELRSHGFMERRHGSVRAVHTLSTRSEDPPFPPA
jgi:hypothetical protein